MIRIEDGQYNLFQVCNMFSMFVMTCIIWIEGSRYDGGEAKCGMHKPDLIFKTLNDCKANIKSYENVLNLTKVWGSEVGIVNCEKFKLIREII